MNVAELLWRGRVCQQLLERACDLGRGCAVGDSPAHARCRNTFRVVGLITSLRDADEWHTRGEGGGNGAETTMGDDGRHVWQYQIVRDEPADRHVRGRIDGAGQQGSPQGQQNPDWQSRNSVEHRRQGCGLPLQGGAEAEQHPWVTGPGQQAGVTPVEWLPGVRVSDRADIPGVGGQRAVRVEARWHQREPCARLIEEAGLLRARRLVAQLVHERRVREMDQDGTWQCEHVGRLQSGAHHAVHHHHIGREALRLGEDVVPRPGAGQRRHESFFQGVLESQSRRPGWHRGIGRELEAGRGRT